MSARRVLIADDSRTVIEILSFLLADLGCEVIVAQDGIEAIEKAYQEGPDLILLDVLMPKMNGYQVCRLLKDDKDTCHIPIVILTAKDQPADRYWGLVIGADEYLSKDLEQETFIERIQGILKRLEVTGERTAPKRSHPITHIDILSRVNNILDRKLYQSTIINEINQLAASMQDFEETLKSIFQLLSRIIEFQIGVISIVGRSRPQKIYIYTSDPVHPSLLSQIARLLAEGSKNKADPEACPYVWLKGHVTEISRLQTLSSSYKVSLVSKGTQIGSILLGDSRTGKLLEEDQNILRIAAKEAAVVIDNARLYDYSAQLYAELEKEILQISDIQRSLFPQTNPLEQAVEIQSAMIPAREASGDYYDYFPVDDHRLVITIGDVTGKGAPTSLLMAMVKTALQIKIDMASSTLPFPADRQGKDGICKVLSFLNQLVRNQRSNQYMTLFLGLLDLQERTITYINAGHNFPYLISPSGPKLRFLKSSFLPLGFEEPHPYTASKQKIVSGDFLFFYTDGLVEARDENRRLFGYERLEEVLLQSCQRPLEQIKQQVLERVQAFCGNMPLEDDMTLVVVKLRQN